MSQTSTKWIVNNSVTNAKLAQMPTLTLKGNNSGGTANALDLTVSQVQTMLSIPTSSSPLPVNSGGTGLSSLTANNVILGNGTGNVLFVAPGTSGNVLTSNGTTWTSAAPATSGTVTSVALADGSTTPIYTISGSPVTTSGTLTLTLSTKAANLVFAGPTTGAAAQPTFRSLVAADLPAGTGTVTSVALADSTGLFNITGSPVTTSGTLTLASFQSQSAKTFFAAPNGGAGAPTFRLIVASDVPTLNQNTTGTAANITATSNSTLTTLTALSLPASQLSGTLAAAQFPALTGDVTTTAGSLATTLATVNSNVGSFTNANITVNAKGLITAASNGTASTSTAPTIQKFTTSSGTYTTPTSPAPLYIRVVMVGAGGGGGGGGTAGAPASGNDGTDSSFGTTLLVAARGLGGQTVPGTGGNSASGTTLGTGPKGIAVAGGFGVNGSTASLADGGGSGGSSFFGGAGRGGAPGGGTGQAAKANSGSGGGGGSASTAVDTGGGGGAAGYVDAVITSPSATYAYVVGAGGTGGAAGTTGSAGGAGADGQIIVYEYYQ